MGISEQFAICVTFVDENELGLLNLSLPLLTARHRNAYEPLLPYSLASMQIPHCSILQPLMNRFSCCMSLLLYIYL